MENPDAGHAPRGGVLAVLLVTGNALCERIGHVGIFANMIVYLTSKYHMSSSSAAKALFLWVAASSFLQIIGGILSDAYVGRFTMILRGSILASLGMALMVFTSYFVHAKPPTCVFDSSSCVSPDAAQWSLLFSSFALMALGTGAMRPNSVAFATDQIRRPQGVARVNAATRFMSLFRASVGVSSLIAVSGIIVLQSQSWFIGFLVSLLVMLIGTVSFFAGRGLYVRVEPERSFLSSFLQVTAAALRKRNVPDPPQGGYLAEGEFIVPSNRLSFLNKACIIVAQEDYENGNPNPWRLCSVKKVEELKMVIRVLPIWACTVIFTMALSQTSFGILQALTMDRRLFSSFEIPAGSFTAFEHLGYIFFLAVYDSILTPLIAMVINNDQGLSRRQRIGVGLLISCVATLVAAPWEQKRREKAIDQGFFNRPSETVDMTAMWLIPQFFLTGLATGFGSLGFKDFFRSQLPDGMESAAHSLWALGVGFGNLLGTIVVTGVSDGGRHIGWIDTNLNKSRLYSYYWLITVFSAVNFLIFIVVAWVYGPENPPAPGAGEGQAGGQVE